jgi:predicted Zn-dependent peptidase
MAKESTSGRMQKLGGDILAYNRIISDKEVRDKIFAVKKSDITKLAENIFASKPTFAAIGKVKNLQL